MPPPDSREAQVSPDEVRVRRRLLRTPGATYRLQFGPGFGFRDAERVVPYLDALDVTDVYASPIFASRSGNSYAICDYNKLDPQLGSEEDFRALSGALRATTLSLILDIVPNHMAASECNAWWMDVLANGRSSKYADYFDIDWDRAGGRIVLPILEDEYDLILRAGKLRVEYDGAPVLRYGERTLPIAAQAWGRTSTDTPDLLNADLAALDELLRAQAYRLVSWRRAGTQVNYRRFFDIDDLVALRAEREEVFRDSHALVLRLIAEGMVTGLRVDHPDGLLDPERYFARLDEAVQDALGAAHSAHLYVVAEKILAHGEQLRPEWHVDGTTGYDFLNSLNGLFVQTDNAAAIDEIYCDFTNSAVGFPDVAYESKSLITRTSLPAEIEALGRALHQTMLSERAERFPEADVVAAARELLIALPVYRTYIAPGRAPSTEDRRYLEAALAQAKERDPGIAPGFLDRIASTLLDSEAEPHLEAITRFQKLSAPLTAKGIEDTAFYRYDRLVSLNEVGGDPEVFGESIEAFHRQNADRAATWRHSMLATATHDTKRGEDTRARINVLSEMPREWGAAIARWAEMNADDKHPVRGMPAPDRNDEYLLYQTLIGTWPHDIGDDRALDAYRTRIVEYMRKATREAKVHTSWIAPDEAYDAAVESFVRAVLSRRGAAFADLDRFANRVASHGRLNSLSQLLLKLTAPGVPDTYQGTELWDLSLVDPDNRHPIDFAQRVDMLRELQADSSQPLFPRDLLDHPEDGRAKMYLLWRTLQFRRTHAVLFAEGAYVPLMATGPKAQHVFAFARALGDDVALTIAPRLFVGLTGADARLPLGSETLGDTTISMANVVAARFRNVLTGEEITLEASERSLPVARVLSQFPVALIERLA